MNTRIQSKRVTIQDVAAAAGVTKSTVSLALAGKGNFSPETRQAIQLAAERLKYKPNPLARRLSTGRDDRTVALFTLRLDLSVGTKKLQLLQNQLAADGFEAPLYTPGSEFGSDAPEILTLIKSICQQQPRAMICNIHGLSSVALKELQRYQDEGGLLVCYDDRTDLMVDSVVFDREDNTYQAVRHLLELGHRDIGMACSSGLRGERYQGFERAMKEFDLRPRREWLLGSEVVDDAGLYSGLYVEGGVRLAQLFLKLKKRPTAVCLMDDSAAVGFAAELERAGVRVPEEVSVIGHDNLPIAQYGPLPLTTVTHPVEDIVANVLELLQSRLQGYDGPPRKIIIRGELIVRESTRPLAVLSGV